MQFTLSLATLITLLGVTSAAPSNEARQFCPTVCLETRPECTAGQITTNAGTTEQPCWSCCRDIVPSLEPKDVTTEACLKICFLEKPTCSGSQYPKNFGSEADPCWSCCWDSQPATLKPKQVDPPTCTKECSSAPSSCGDGNGFPALSGACWSCCNGDNHPSETRECKNNTGVCDKSLSCFENEVAPEFGEGRCAVNIRGEGETPCWKNCGGEREA